MECRGCCPARSPWTARYGAGRRTPRTTRHPGDNRRECVCVRVPITTQLIRLRGWAHPPFPSSLRAFRSPIYSLVHLPLYASLNSALSHSPLPSFARTLLFPSPRCPLVPLHPPPARTAFDAGAGIPDAVAALSLPGASACAHAYTHALKHTARSSPTRASGALISRRSRATYGSCSSSIRLLLSPPFPLSSPLLSLSSPSFALFALFLSSLTRRHSLLPPFALLPSLP